MPELGKDARQTFWSRPGTFAIVGSFESPKTLSWRILEQCGNDGIAAVPVNPDAREVLGQTTVADPGGIADLAGIVCVRLDPHATWAVEQAARLNVPVWLSLRTASDDARAAAQRTGVEIISEVCPMLYMSGLKAPHTWHRFGAKLFGKY